MAESLEIPSCCCSKKFSDRAKCQLGGENREMARSARRIQLCTLGSPSNKNPRLSLRDILKISRDDSRSFTFLARRHNVCLFSRHTTHLSPAWGSRALAVMKKSYWSLLYDTSASISRTILAAERCISREIIYARARDYFAR